MSEALLVWISRPKSVLKLSSNSTEVLAKVYPASTAEPTGGVTSSVGLTVNVSAATSKSAVMSETLLELTVMPRLEKLIV